MTESSNVSEHRNRAPIWGIILLFLGIVLLLQTFNVLPWSLWGTLWRFWPAIIIIIGLAILLRRYSLWLISLIAVIILGASLGIAIYQNNDGNFNGKTSFETYTQPLGGLNNATVEIDFSAGNLVVGSLAGGSTNLVYVKAETQDSHSSMQAFSQDGVGNLVLHSINQQYWPNGGIDWEADFTQNIPLLFDITSAASSLKLNFSDINLEGLTLNLSAGSCNIEFPLPRGVVNADLQDNAANIEIFLPSDAAARIQGSTNVGLFDVSSRFIRQGEVYETENYNGAADRIEWTINTNVGRVKVN